MNTSKNITGVKVITKIEKPVVVLELDGHPAVVRNLKQMFTDLQNSGRILDVKSVNDPRFTDECFKLVGAQLTGDLKAFKAGDTYKVTEGHPDVANGTAKVGDIKTADKDGVWVEGFLSIPLTFMERQMQANANAYASFLGNMFGFTATPVTTTSTPAANGFTPELEPEAETANDLALGNN